MTHTGSPSCPDRVHHIPYADGQAPIVLSDTDDHAVIDATLCESIKSNGCSCLDFEDPPSFAPGPAEEEVDCSENVPPG